MSDEKRIIDILVYGYECDQVVRHSDVLDIEISASSQDGNTWFDVYDSDGKVVRSINGKYVVEIIYKYLKD